MNISQIPVWQRVHLAWTVVLAGLASTAAAEYPPRYPDRTNLLVYINEDGSETPITTLEQWEKRREHILQNMTKVFGELPDESKRCDLDVQVLEVVETPLYVRKKITYRPLLGCRVPAYLFIPRQVEGKRPAVLCLHQTNRLGILIPAGIAHSGNHHAKDLAERGYITLAPSNRTSPYVEDGIVSDDGKPYDAYENGYASWMGSMTVWNHMRAVDLLQSLDEVDSEKIGAIGHSLGCFNSLFLAAYDDRVKALACSAGVTSLEKHKTTRDEEGKLTVWDDGLYFPRIRTIYDRDANKVPFDFPEILGTIAPRAIYINAPLGDYMNPIAALDCLYAAVPVYQLYNSPKTITLVMPPGGHNLPAWVQDEMYEFFDREFEVDRHE